MASSAQVGSLKTVVPTSLMYVIVLLLLVVCPLMISALQHPKRPKTMTFYIQEIKGVGENATMRVITTTNTLGFVAVLNQRITEGPLLTSKHIGQEVGLITRWGNTLKSIYGAFEMQIQSDKYNGTFLTQGAFDLTVPVRTLAIVGGTGDFYLARGYATFTTSAVKSAEITVVYKLCFLDHCVYLGGNHEAMGVLKHMFLVGYEGNLMLQRVTSPRAAKPSIKKASEYPSEV